LGFEVKYYIGRAEITISYPIAYSHAFINLARGLAVIGQE
jgi:hypothetical protein